MITTNILGVRIFRKFRVCSVPPSSHSTVHILNRISCKLGQLSRALGWYSSLNHISCKLGQLSRALGSYSSLNHISCKLGQLSRALGSYSSLNHMPWHTVQTQMSSLIRVYTVCHSVCTVWAHYSTEEPHSSNFRVITTNLLGVQIFRKFTVCFVPPSSHSYVHILNHISCKLGQLSRALGWYSNLNHISCNLGQLSRALCWYSNLNHISCKLGQLSWALGWYSSLNHISYKLGQLSRALGLIFKSQPYLL